MSIETRWIARQPFDDRDDARELLLDRHRLGARPRGLAADVDDVGALGTSRRPCSTAWAASSNCPPSEKESGVTLTTPMTSNFTP